MTMTDQFRTTPQCKRLPTRDAGTLHLPSQRAWDPTQLGTLPHHATQPARHKDLGRNMAYMERRKHVRRGCIRLISVKTAY